MAREAVEAALIIARARHEAIACGDVDAFAGFDAEFGAASARLTGGGAANLAASDIPALDELIGLETQSRALLRALMDETSLRLDSLRQSGLASRAYLRHEQFFVNPA